MLRFESLTFQYILNFAVEIQAMFHVESIVYKLCTVVYANTVCSHPVFSIDSMIVHMYPLLLHKAEYNDLRMKERYQGMVEFVKVLQARLRALSAEADEIERAKYEGEPER